jgi:Flp pilus assembly protein TadD
MTREEALAEVSQALQLSTRNPKAIRLMTLFHLQGEELAEAGVRYETLRQLSPLLSV